MPTDTLAPAHISADVAALPDDWEALVSAAIMQVEDEEVRRWTIGEIGKRIKDNAAYGEHRVRDFAHSVGLQAPTIYERIDLVEFYPIHLRNYARAEYLGLRWTHYRIAKQIKDLEKAEILLNMTIDMGLTTLQLKARVHELTGKPPVLKKVVDAPLCVVADDREYMINGDGLVYVAIALPAADAEIVRGISGGTIRVYQVVTGEAAKEAA